MRHGRQTGEFSTLPGPGPGPGPGRDPGPVHVHRLTRARLVGAPAFEGIAPHFGEARLDILRGGQPTRGRKAWRHVGLGDRGCQDETILCRLIPHRPTQRPFQFRAN
ncbi:hypothetical protein GT043_09465 [Streptomyces sp. SID2131]|nr:hypothetical protein [Streptomyces sp. SID2131]